MIEFDCEGCGVHVVDLGSVKFEAAEPCVPGMSGSKMAQSSGAGGGKPSDSSS